MAEGVRFEFDPDPALSAVAKATHHCGYIKRRNATLKQAEANADALARAELPGEASGSPKWNMIQVKHFHAEMARLNGTPNYVPRLSVVAS